MGFHLKQRVLRWYPQYRTFGRRMGRIRWICEVHTTCRRDLLDHDPLHWLQDNMRSQWSMGKGDQHNGYDFGRRGGDYTIHGEQYQRCELHLQLHHLREGSM